MEFQVRGIPCIHSSFWIKKAPKLSPGPEEEYVKFIEKIIRIKLKERLRLIQP